MLNKYIEKRITDKITILNILLDIRSIELDELSTLTSLQSKSLLSILQELQETFEEELTFNPKSFIPLSTRCNLQNP